MVGQHRRTGGRPPVLHDVVEVQREAVRSPVAGPSSSVPSGAKRDPCSGHSQAWSASFQLTIPPRCGHTGETRCSTPATRHLASRSQGGPLTTPPSSPVGLRRPVRIEGVIQPLVRFKPTWRFDCIAVRRPESSCVLQLANALDQSIRRPSTRLDSASAAAGPFVIPHLLKPVATRMLSLPGKIGQRRASRQSACNPARTRNASAPLRVNACPPKRIAP